MVVVGVGSGLGGGRAWFAWRGLVWRGVVRLMAGRGWWGCGCGWRAYVVWFDVFCRMIVVGGR